ncbi:unnamed protein product, partial [Coccothraustes coccothraustes]
TFQCISRGSFRCSRRNLGPWALPGAEGAGSECRSPPRTAEGAAGTAPSSAGPAAPRD